MERAHFRQSFISPRVKGYQRLSDLQVRSNWFISTCAARCVAVSRIAVSRVFRVELRSDAMRRNRARHTAENAAPGKKSATDIGTNCFRSR